MSDQQLNADNIAALREQAQASEANRIAAESVARENAMLKAGIDVESPLGGMFLSAYKGDLTTEAIRAQAAQVGAWKDPATAPPPPADPSQTPPPQQQPGTQTYDPVEAAMRQLAANGVASGAPGGSETPPPPPDAMKDAYEEFTGLVTRGRTREDAAIAVMGRKLQAAAAGDASVLFDAERDREGTRQDLRVPSQWMGL
jgi:hypothetical protein